MKAAIVNAAVLTARVGLVGRRVRFLADITVDNQIPALAYLVVEAHFAPAVSGWYVLLVNLETGQLTSSRATELALLEVDA